MAGKDQVRKTNRDKPHYSNFWCNTFKISLAQVFDKCRDSLEATFARPVLSLPKGFFTRNYSKMAHCMYVLIHSPLAGPLTWSRAASEMRECGLDVFVPVLEDSPGSGDPYWKQHADSVARSFRGSPNDISIILVAHSGAGPLLPAIRQSISNPVHAYVFLDAGFPRDGATRLDLMKWEDAEWAHEFQVYLERGGRFPNWNYEDLRDVLPNELIRAQMIAELHPRGLDFFTEPIPVFQGWPEAHCIYILFSPPYKRAEKQVRQMGWITETLEAGHFHMLVDPVAVVDRITSALNRIKGSE